MNRFIQPLTLALVIFVGVDQASANDGRDDRSRQSTAKLHFFSAGISKYQSGNDLRWCHKDALDMEKFWKSQQGRSFAEVQTQVLIDNQASSQAVRRGLEMKRQELKSGDWFVIHLAGHGGFSPYRDNDWIFTTYDFTWGSFENTGISGKYLRELGNELSRRGVTVVMILDSCHSGAVGLRNIDFVLLASSTTHQSSGEGNPGTPSITNGYYSLALLEAMEGKADANQDGVITLEEVDAFVIRRLRELDNRPNAPLGTQCPVIARPKGLNGSFPLVQLR